MSTESVDETTPAAGTDPAFWVSEQAVYGVILVGGLILVAGEHGDASWDTFWTVLVTVLVFWLAHVFAGVVAHPEFLRGVNGSLPRAIRSSVHHARGLLVAAVPPCLVLFLGSWGIIDDGVAIELALWSGILVLAWLGFLIFWRAGYGILGRLLGALITGGFGVILIVVKAIVH